MDFVNGHTRALERLIEIHTHTHKADSFFYLRLPPVIQDTRRYAHEKRERERMSFDEV